jgi:hypothetical protein
MNFESRNIIALLLLFVTISGIVMSFGDNVLCAGELPGAHETASISHEHDMAQIHGNSCPCTPSPQHSPDDHICIDDCDCPCNAPLPSTILTYTTHRSFTNLYHAELIQQFPEVYLSLFVPPDSAAV